MNNIQKTIEFVKDLFENSVYLQDKAQEKEYRLNHTYRVAAIGKEIALAEHLDVEAVVIGCLLHDISYVDEMTTNEERKGHGRKSAQMSRTFVMSLDMDDQLKNELLFGVAIHVDDVADFECERTILAETIGEADNIDRFDAYRLYEGLLYSRLDTMTLSDQIDFVSSKLKRLKELKDYKFQSNTSNRLWNEKLDYQINYYHKLQNQLLKSNPSDLI